MDLLMQRDKIDSTGCFSIITDLQGNFVCLGAEHSYQQPDGTWQPKVPLGTYTCQLGNYTLGHAPNFYPFHTYEILNVPGHFGILFHKGNLPEKDSDGCVLLGTVEGELDGEPAVLDSEAGFQAFYNLQQGVSQFKITIS